MDRIPAPWQLRECKEHPGRVFYYNPLTNESTWIRPVPMPNTEYDSWPPMVYIYHILVRHRESKAFGRDSAGSHRTREDAQQKVVNIHRDLVLRLRDFEDIAKDESDCPESRKDGGCLGWIHRGRMTRAFNDVAFSLEVGEISKPVETELGWHLIMRKA